MKKQLIITLTVLILAIAMAGAVSATVDPSVKYVSPTGNDDNDGTETNPYLTIGKGITSVSADGTVNVADGTYYEHLTIDKNLNLVGQSQENTIIDGSNTGKPLTITSGATVGISLFTIQNGVSGFSGGGIDNYGTVTVNNNTFINNSATYGGAIFNAYGSTLYVSDSTFIDNNGIFGGGAIYDAEGTSTVTGSTFTNNLADYGGAIYTYGTVTVSDSTFTGNSATTHGGAIFNHYGGTMSVTDSSFNDNTANYGGAICNFDSSVSVTDSSFTSNTAQRGGGIYNTGHLTIENCELISNSASNTQGYAYGGAIYNILGTLSINNSKIQKNTATGAWNSGSAGAIYNYEGFLSIKNSLVEENTAQYGGALFFIHQTLNVVGEVIIENCSISKNIATGSAGAMVTYLPTTIIDSVIRDNIAQGIYSYGGAIIQYNHGSLTIIRTLIENNQASREGGAIYSETYQDGFLTIQDSKITGNSAEKGGAIYSDNYGLTSIINCIIEGNTASLDGGFLYKNDDRGSALLKFNRIIANTALNGAALYNYRNSAFNAEYNWWGSNNPDFTTLIGGVVDYSPWLYMTFQATPDSIAQGETSTLTASFNQAFDGTTVTQLNPVNGHLPDGILVTFKTDLGQLGSQTVDKPTTGGVATATLNGTESGLATVKAALDTEELIDTVQIGVEPPETGVFTRLMVQDAAIRVRNFITSRGVLPNWVRMEDTSGVTHYVTMPVFLELSTASLISGANEFKAMDVKTAPKPVGPTIVNRNLYKSGYMNMALRVNNFIRNNGVAPNFAWSSLGNIRFQSLVDSFTRIVAFKAERGVLPNYVVINTRRVR